jgi:serine/threonine-protein kinase
MSPEQHRGEPLDGRADLYSLGVIAYNLIAGRVPFPGTTIATIAIGHLQKPPPDIRQYRHNLDPLWLALLDKLLAKGREDRFESAEDALAVMPSLPV